MSDSAQDPLTAIPVPTLADAVEEVEEKQDDYQAMYNAGGHFKEQLEAISGTWPKEKVDHIQAQAREATEVEEVPNNVEVEKHPELDGYIQKIDKDAELTNPVIDDYTQSVLLSSTATQKPQVQLPLTSEQIEEGLHRKVFEAVRWLAVWCLRQLKMRPAA